jgi:effector-binding domain-containing protein
MPNYDVVIKTVPAMLVASRRVTIPTNDQVPQYLGPAYTEAYDYVRKQGAKDSGPCFALWHSPADVYENEDAEAIVPIDRPLKGTDRVKVYELPPAQVASVVHHGNFEDFTQGHAALFEWIDANGKYFLNMKPVDPAALEDYLRSTFAARTEDKILYFKADNNLKFARVQDAVEMARRAGVRVMAAITEPTADKGLFGKEEE